MINRGNIFKDIPNQSNLEIFENLFKNSSVRIERIVSSGQSSPEDFWYNQNENEWVIVIEGSACILFESGEELILTKGDYFFIPANRKHRVQWTAPNENTIWLVCFFSNF